MAAIRELPSATRMAALKFENTITQPLYRWVNLLRLWVVDSTLLERARSVIK